MISREFDLEEPHPTRAFDSTAWNPAERRAWGAVSGVLRLGKFLRVRFEGISPLQADVLGLPGASTLVDDEVDLGVKVWRADESQRDAFVGLLDRTPMRWESAPDGLRIAERYFLAAVPSRTSLPRSADLWTFWETAPPFATAVTNFTRLVLSSGFAFPGTYLIHSSVFVLRSGIAALFFGPSGAGKSTLGSLALSAGYQPLSDDLNLVETSADGAVYVQPFPWAGDHGPRRFHDLPSFRLGGVFKLEKADRHEVIPLAPAKAVAGLAACSPFVNSEPGRYGPLLDSLGDLVRSVPRFTLRFRKDPGFLDIVEGALR